MKKITVLIIITAVLLNSLSVSFAESDRYRMSESDKELSGYDAYTIVFSSIEPKLYGANVIQTQYCYAKGMESIDCAIEFVKSIHPDDSNNEFIIDACLNELVELKEINAAGLLDYTVLIPHSTRSDTLYGTYNGRTFYYTLSSTFNPTPFTLTGDNISQTHYNQWASGLVGILLGLLGNEYSIPYSLVQLAYGSTSAGLYWSTGDHLEYYIQPKNIRSRSIYTYSGSTKKVVLIDQSGYAHIQTQFVPGPNNNTIGKATISQLQYEPACTKYYNATSRNLQKAYQMYTHSGQEIWYIVNELASEVWQ